MYGLIGEKLGHSFSKIIHETFANYTYDLIPLTKQELDCFLKEKAFSAVNVTIPYKEMVIPYLEHLHETAQKVGAVNAIVNKNGVLTGYNTDYFGFRYQLQQNKIEIKGKKVLVLGKGGAAKAVLAVLQDMEAKDIITVYYKEDKNTVSYTECYAKHTDAQVVINTTPVGMYPNTDQTPLDITNFSALEAVVDVVYNPLRTKLVLDGIKKGCISVGGLEMLIAQAKYAVEIFTEKAVSDEAMLDLVEKMKKDSGNLVLIGMSGCGKSTIGQKVAEQMQRNFIDTDTEIIKKINMPIATYFEKFGENAFRAVEQEVIAEVSKQNGVVIATGGGVVLSEKNIEMLQQNGYLIWLKREIAQLEIGNGRPLAKNFDDVNQLYQKRIPYYQKAAHMIVENQKEQYAVAKDVIHAYVSIHAI